MRSYRYKGRLAIHEVLLVDNELRSLIISKRSDNEYYEHALKQGMIPIMVDGLSKAAEGLTTVTEVFRVLGLGE